MVAPFSEDVAIAVDSGGAAHVAVGTEQGVVYATNVSGEWQQERISTAHRRGYDGQPSIAADGDGTIVVAYARFGAVECYQIACAPGDGLGIDVVVKDDEGWSDPHTVGERGAGEPAVAVRDGTIHLVYLVDNSVRYAVGSVDQWRDVLIGPDGDTPTVQLAPDGRALVAFARYDDETGDFVLFHALVPDGSGSPELLEGPLLSFSTWPVFDSAIDAHGLFHIVSAAGRQTFGDGWSEPTPVFDQVSVEYTNGYREWLTPEPGALGLGPDGDTHVVSENDYAGVWYSTDATGTFATYPLTGPTGFGEDGPQGTSDIAVDALSRPHLVFNVHREDEEGVWYALGTGP